MTSGVDAAIAHADAALFDDAVSCHDRLPAQFVADGVDGRAVESLFERAEALLRTIAQIEDAGDEDDRGADPALQRIEAKLNVLLELVGAMAAQRSAAPAPVDLRWSRHGMSIAHAGPADVGQVGLVRLQPAAWLPQLLELPCVVIAVAARPPQLWLRTDPLPPSLETALERHLFRLHRRAIARRPR